MLLPLSRSVKNSISRAGYKQPSLPKLAPRCCRPLSATPGKVMAAPPSKRISPKSANRLDTLDPSGTVFAEFTALAIKHDAVNLGQGFPTLPVPTFITECATRAIQTDGLLHQYTRSEGHVNLVKALSSYYVDKLGRTLDPFTEIVTTVGASEAIYSAIQAFVNPGDEVILMQPFYDSYPASVTLAGGVPVMVSLRPPAERPAATSDDWKLDIDEIRRAINPGKTKMIIVNNPHNPVGKVFTRTELESIAKIADEFDLLVLADEVYETLVYSDSVSPMIKFASLPGMFERTITVGSVGKMFGVTGWKVGWILSTPEIVRSEATAQALALALQNKYFPTTAALYESLRNKLHALLATHSITPTLPHGGYFILADTSSLPDTDTVNPEESRRDYRVCRYLTTEGGVTAIPPSAFYDVKDREGREQVAGKLARFAFCKSEGMLDEAAGKLEGFFKKIAPGRK
ncbi:Kynurenine--oxoglutarate transaminase 3 [Rhizophlyctis rosea]|uniref:Kynurenine--oxoglutarate transaminase 3 n=1 Tax=Rhizophlyctis rosea TaxID=64517 RepID=A0AAD5SGY9_9FUNG|nr:Kynurenine--oxoglutarate transaminase 3 [Rhizophlyctis rosea]